jgi:hypothetical protein
MSVAAFDGDVNVRSPSIVTPRSGSIKDDPFYIRMPTNCTNDLVEQLGTQPDRL